MLLHPQAEDLLFNHYRVLRLIFNDVLGHLELDYLSIGLLNKNKEWFFLSSQPSIEQNLIAHELWDQDPCFHLPWVQNEQALIWNTRYQTSQLKTLAHFKLSLPGFAFGFSTLMDSHQQPLVYSFAVKNKDTAVHRHLIEQQETLNAMAKFCLHNITKEIKLDLGFECRILKPSLKLVVNNC